MTLDVETTSSATCAHCGLTVPRGLIDANASEQFCCAGCRAVYETLHACGLEAYYRLRDSADVEPTPAKTSDSKFVEFDSPTFHELYVQRRADGLAVVDLTLENVTCVACVWLVERLPRVLKGVIEARLSLRGAMVRVTWDSSRLPLSTVARALSRLGYPPHASRGDGGGVHRLETRRRLISVGIAGAIAANAMLLSFALYSGDAGHIDPIYRSFFRWLSTGLGLTSLAGPGATFFRGAWAAIRAKAVNFDVPIALALVAGGLAGLFNVASGRGEIYFDSLTALVFLLLVGRFIQYCQQRRADDSVGLLFNLTPSVCHLLQNGELIDAPVEALQVGDEIEIRPGELFPADGQVVAGRSLVNAALLTGESQPVAVNAGAEVCAGSQNVDSPVRVRVDEVGRDTRIGKLMKLVERGVQEKPGIVQFADRVGAWFAVVVPVAAAIVLAAWWHAGLAKAIDHAVALLIVTCPCVLGVSTPLTLAIAIGRLAQRDILVKSAAALERLSNGGRIVLDKTGTLTDAKLELLSWDGKSTLPCGTNVRALVGEIERTSNHPIGRALHEAFGREELTAVDRVKLTNVVEAGNGGVTARFGDDSIAVGSALFALKAHVFIPRALRQVIEDSKHRGLTSVVVAMDTTATAIITLGDGIRPDSAEAVKSLQMLGWNPSILSGDAQEVVSSVANAVDIAIDRALGEQSPEQKLAAVHRKAGEPCTVMVGDGVNDAAALAAADVGVAVHGGAEASLSAADVYIARPGLAPLVDLVRTSRHAMRVVRRNLLISLTYNIFAGAMAASGHMTPLFAAILMPVSSATVLSLAAVSMRRGERSETWK